MLVSDETVLQTLRIQIVYIVMYIFYIWICNFCGLNNKT